MNREDGPTRDSQPNKNSNSWELREVMKVTVKLFATLRKDRFHSDQIILSDNATSNDLLKELKIPQDHVGILLVDGKNVSVNSEISDGQTVSIFPAVGGG